MTQILPNKPHNRILADTFHRMAAYYRYQGSEQRFRAIAFENASRIIDGLKDDISKYASNVKSLDAISGISESINEKIIEYLNNREIKYVRNFRKNNIEHELA
jgi:DNA polymerase (family X)